ncbi:hypothetical protein AERO9A_110009 [Aeromonas salmonicida]|nr:hypothetical protein AERO9A_110009 [Aeromonas salmonicida]
MTPDRQRTLDNGVCNTCMVFLNVGRPSFNGYRYFICLCEEGKKEKNNSERFHFWSLEYGHIPSVDSRLALGSPGPSFSTGVEILDTTPW